MINRVLIRIRVVQMLFSFSQNETNDIKKAEAEFLFSLQKSYDLYFYFLLLLIEITDEYQARVEARKSRLRPTEADMKPNTRLIDNKFIAQLRVNKQFNKHLDEYPFSWYEQENFVKNLLNTILESNIYKEYSTAENNDYEADRDFWKTVFKQIICADESIHTLLEDESLFWNDDIEIVQSFALKTIKRFEESAGADQELLPMFKDYTDREFAIKLLRESFLNEGEYRALIDKHTKNWESERIALMDMIIMQIAIAELINFPSIPTNVTLNEYIDISKSYSTAKSASFINGILDTIVKELTEANKINKQQSFRSSALAYKASANSK